MAGAEAVGLAALGWLASPVIKELFRKAISYLVSDIVMDLEDLETTLIPLFEFTIQVAQNSRHKDKLSKWLVRLKNAYYDAEAILHELEYECLERRAKGGGEKVAVSISSHSIIKPLAKVTRKVSQLLSLLSPQKKRLLGQLNELKKIAAEAKYFHKLLETQSRIEYGALAANTTSDISSALLSCKVIGRDDVRDQIIDSLLNDQEASSSIKSNSVFAITGIGGAGKTTLAQYVYHNEDVKRHFEVRMWLRLSANKKVKDLTREMIECATGKKCPSLLNLTVLHNKLIDSLSESKSILLVLDNVWYNPMEEKWWDNLLAPFDSIGGRCKIIVTSRQISFPNALSRGKNIIIELGDLTPDDFKSLFLYYAMDGLELDDPQLKNALFDIGDEIARKMCKSPLAARVVGNQLWKRPEIEFWLDTLKNDNLSSTRNVLLWNYYHLDVQLQRCFLFFSAFPKGTCFRSGNELVQYWVALDFIRSSTNNINLEAIGFEYVDKLVAYCMLQLMDGKYYMHDLFHDLAEYLSMGDYFRVTNFEKEIPSTTLYAYIRVDNENSINSNLWSSYNLRNLRALILDIRINTLQDLNEFFPVIFTKIKNLRVLEIWSSCSLKELSSVLGYLRNLMYLNISSSSIEELSNSVSRLYHLQFLNLPAFIKTLPPKLSNLIKLRSIVMYDTNYNVVHTLPPIPYLGKLTSLQNLDEFHVRKEEGHELWQLGRLREIAGSLRIVNLNNVKHKDESVEARLIDKPKLKRLELIWEESSENVSDLEVIEALHLTKNLKDLSVEGYRGFECPSWLQEGLSLRNIKFYNCNGLTNFPNFQRCYYLTELIICNCPFFIFVCENELQLNENNTDMEEKFWLLRPKNIIGYTKDVFDLELKSFKKTGSAQSCPEQLKIIECAVEDSSPELTEDVERAWWHCHQQRMNFIFRRKTGENKLILPPRLCVLVIKSCCISNGTLSDCLRDMSSLKELYLEGIMTITTLPPAEILKSLQRLQVLEISYCWCLRSLGGLHALPNLEKFTIDSCWSLKMRSDHT